MVTTTPTQIGPYRILDVLGEGGMGTVYLAQQETPVRRRVALKLIKLGMDSKTVVARFEQERQALALMQHDGIARVFDCGTSERGQPYFVMEYVKGVPLTDYCETQRTTLQQRIALMQQVCAAVTHAHQKGVVHRDLKPSNVLVTEDQGREQIKIIDFGLAKAMGRELVEATLFTEVGQVVGTPEYMAPEQADPNNADVDTRADVYSLGAMLYELLVSALPFSRQELRRAGILEVQRILREVEPPRPSVRLSSSGDSSTAIAEARRTSVGALQHALRSDLDWLVMKAIEKDRARRYATANALSADLQRFLDHEPLVAGPPSAGYRLKKLLRRHRGQVLAAGAVLVTAITGALVAVDYAVQAEGLADDLQGKVGEFEQLKVVVLHQRAVAEDARLYPPWPAQIADMEAWLRECRPLLAMREGIETTVQALRARALPATAAELRLDAETHPRAAELQTLAQRRQSLQRAQALRGGGPPIVPPLDALWQQLPALSLNQLAYLRVAPGSARQVYGEEALGLACARAALAKAKGTANECWILDTLAWALLANGQDADARARSTEALAVTPAGYMELMRNQQRDLTRASEGALAELDATVAAQAGLAAEVQARRTFRFAATDAAAGFLHDTLGELLRQLATLEQRELALVQQRLRWARWIESAGSEHPNARVTWTATRQAIAAADGVSASALYGGQRIELRDQDVIGLVPLGPDPVTKLWEFYDLRSAWDGALDPAAIAIPERGADGRFAIGEQTGIVLVLLPGGEFVMGSQSADPTGPNHDSQAQEDEAVHPVRLAPFFVGKYELTQGQWQRLWTWDAERRLPSFYRAGQTAHGTTLTRAHPVEQVDWQMCTTLLQRHGMALPTEAQWEYACRGGSPLPWWSGSEPADLDGRANVLDRTGVGLVQIVERGESFDDRFAAHAPVGSFAPNGFGLHDVHGNVWEWCQDLIGDYGAERPEDGLRPPGSVPHRVMRGGSFKQPALVARSANRSTNEPSSRDDYLGLRCARPIRQPD